MKRAFQTACVLTVSTALATSLSRGGQAPAEPNAGASKQMQAALNPKLPPSGNFDLKTWNLTLPIGEEHKPDIKSTAQIANKYTSKYFYTGSDGAMVFWAPVTGVTTKNSHYPRSELRETRLDGKPHNWNVADGKATLSATVAVNNIPNNGKIVIGQIHDNGASGVPNEPMLKLLYKYDKAARTGSVIAQVRDTPTAASVNHPLGSKFKLDAHFSYLIELSADRNLRISIDGVERFKRVVGAEWKSEGLYFKAGVYVQDNVGPETEGGRVSFYALKATHVSN